jgi:hypothetical protein
MLTTMGYPGVLRTFCRKGKGPVPGRGKASFPEGGGPSSRKGGVALKDLPDAVPGAVADRGFEVAK